MWALVDPGARQGDRRVAHQEAATLDAGEDKVIEVDDVSRAFFEADMQRDVCIELPAEDLDEADLNEDLVGYLHEPRENY